MVTVPLARRNSISLMVEQKCQHLLDLSKKVVDYQLEEGKQKFVAFIVHYIFSSTGMLRFSQGREAALSKLFKELRTIMVELKNKDERTFAQRCLKKDIMASPHDIRGSRRLFVIFSLMKVKSKVAHYTFSLPLPVRHIGSHFLIICGLSASAQFTHCKVYFSLRPKKLEHILKFPSCYVI